MDETATELRVSRSTINRLLDAGELKSFKIGRRRLIPIHSVEAYVAKLTGTAA